MILVDSSVFIDFFRDTETPKVEALRRRLGREPVAVGDLVLMEVLQGFRTEREVEKARLALGAFPTVDIAGVEVALAAARNYRHLRVRGITVRKTIDCLIATRCIQSGLPLLYSDRDFDPFVQHLGLQPVTS